MEDVAIVVAIASVHTKVLHCLWAATEKGRETEEERKRELESEGEEGAYGVVGRTH